MVASKSIQVVHGLVWNYFGGLLQRLFSSVDCVCDNYLCGIDNLYCQCLVETVSILL